MSDNKRLGPLAKEPLAASDYLLQLLTLKVEPHLTDTDLRLMAERIIAECQAVGVNPTVWRLGCRLNQHEQGEEPLCGQSLEQSPRLQEDQQAGP